MFGWWFIVGCLYVYKIHKGDAFKIKTGINEWRNMANVDETAAIFIKPEAFLMKVDLLRISTIE